MKNRILFSFMLLAISSFSQEDLTNSKPVELKIRESNKETISKVSNERTLERKQIHENHKEHIRENLRHDTHHRPHFENKNQKDNQRRDHLQRDLKNEHRNHKSERPGKN